MSPLVLGPIDDVIVLGAGTAFPRHVLDNDAVLKRLGRHDDDEQRAFAAAGVRASLGVHERAWAHWVGGPFLDDEETTIDLAERAVRDALADAGCALADIDALLVSTSTPPHWTSTVAAAVGARLGVQCACVDVRGGCASSLYAFTQAALLVRAGARHVVIVGTDTFSKAIPPGHAPTALSLADGAGAVVVGRGAGTLRASMFCTDGSHAGLVNTPGVLPPRARDVDSGAFFLSGDAQGLADVVPGKYVDAITRVLERAQLRAVDLDLYVPHQTSKPLLDEVCARMSIARERTIDVVERHANTGAASVFVALAAARKANRLHGNVLLASVGGGLSWAALVLSC